MNYSKRTFTPANENRQNRDDSPKADYYNACQAIVRRGSDGSDERTDFLKVGVAFPSKTGNIHLNLDAIPINWDGKLVLFPKEKKEQ